MIHPAAGHSSAASCLFEICDRVSTTKPYDSLIHETWMTVSADAAHTNSHETNTHILGSDGVAWGCGRQTWVPRRRCHQSDWSPEEMNYYNNNNLLPKQSAECKFLHTHITGKDRGLGRDGSCDQPARLPPPVVPGLGRCRKKIFVFRDPDRQPHRCQIVSPMYP